VIAVVSNAIREQIIVLIITGNVTQDVLMANRNLNPDQFKFVDDADDSTYHIDAFHPDAYGGAVPFAGMTWNRSSGEIHNIYVDDDYRRQGIATRMYKEAHDFPTKPLHAPDSHRTALGKKWSKSVGGDSVE